MTIITKPLSEKKPEDKLEVPLVTNEIPSGNNPPEDAESGQVDPAERRRFVILHARARRISATTTILLCMTAVTVVGVGIVGGTYLYQQFLRSQRNFRGWCNIPYDSEAAGQNPLFLSPERLNGELTDQEIINRAFRNIDGEAPSNNDIDNYFQESFVLDLNTDAYEKIDVPDFRDGRSGRFIHDFNTNTTGIVDLTGKHCFVMPLNREMVLPPRTLYDLIQKMWDGYYNIDTQVVRETMKVVTPAMDKDDLKSVGPFIYKECQNIPTYKLEKYVGGVVKRSADLPSDAKFAQFSGKGIIEFDIVNFDEVAN